MNTSLTRGSLAVRATAIVGLAALSDYLLYGLPLGFNIAVFVAALVFALLATRVRTGIEAPSRYVALALLGLAGALAIEPGPLTVLLTLLGLATLSTWLRSGADRELTVWVGKMISWWTTAWLTPLLQIRPLSKGLRRLRLGAVTPALANWVLPVLFSCVFIRLFCIANPVLASGIAWVESVLGRAMWRLFSGAELGRMFVASVVATAVMVLLRFRTRGWFAGAEDAQLSFRPDVIATDTVVRCLIMFNLVFALQTAVDLGVLFTGGGLPAGMTYAEYAHRGAYPLIATALLAGLFVTVTFSSGQKAAEQTGARRLVYAWIAQNLVLLASTVYRHMMYVDAYGLTRWRLATIIWLGIVAVGFVLTARRIVTGRSNGWLLRMNAGVVIAVLYVCCFVNWTGHIATYNTRHCAEIGGTGPALDVWYLVQLGPASLPALETHLAALDRAMGPHNLGSVERAISTLEHQVRHARSDWRTTTVRAMLVSGSR